MKGCTHSAVRGELNTPGGALNVSALVIPFSNQIFKLPQLSVTLVPFLKFKMFSSSIVYKV